MFGLGFITKTTQFELKAERHEKANPDIVYLDLTYFQRSSVNTQANILHLQQQHKQKLCK